MAHCTSAGREGAVWGGSGRAGSAGRVLSGGGRRPLHPQRSTGHIPRRSAPVAYIGEMTPRWTPTFSLDRVPLGGARLFKQDTVQVAVFHTADGVFAVDNRCPHQGYPLVQGVVAGCVLTCQWHNYKFDLRDGACVMGEEGVRSYPVRVVEGQVEVDLAPPASLLVGLRADLLAALQRHETGRVARDVVRLLDLGDTVPALARLGARFDADRGEYGPSHALALAAAVAVRATPGVDPVLPLVQALDLAAESAALRPVRAIPAPVDPGPDPVAAGAQVRALVEAERGAEAEALVRGAVARGWGRAELQPWFFALASDHFLDFGHALIYAVATFDLLDAAPDPDDAAAILGALIWGIACGTREDLLPRWAGWRRRVATLTGAPDRSGVLPLDALVGVEPAAAFALVAVTADPLAALAVAAAERLLRFDPAIDADPTLAEGWLDVTHTLTFVHAVRNARARGADAQRLLLQATQFVTMAHPLDGPRRAIVPTAATLAEVVDAVAARAMELAVDRAAGYLRDGDVDALVAALEARAWRDHGVRPIFVAHHVKTLRAGAAERLATGDDRPLLGAVRFLAGPVRERSIERVVSDAVALVREGRPPRSLVG
jgi:nitrite reductase/ring-hydroxylating ferredoxin subunit